MIIKKTINNIFTEKYSAPKQIQRQTIIADYREKNCLVASELVHLGIDVEFKELKVADYIIKNTAIERKTVSDFISSMINGRLVNQLHEIQQYENKLLIIEGTSEKDLYNNNNHSGKGVNENAIRSFLLSIIFKHKVPIIFTKDSEDTAKFISVLAKRLSKPNSETPLNVKKKSLNKKEQMQFIIESFPGIGPKTTKKLLAKFKTIKNLINSSEEELKKVMGKKAETIIKIIEDEYD